MKVRTPYGPDHVRDMTEAEYNNLRNQGVRVEKVAEKRHSPAPKPPAPKPAVDHDVHSGIKPEDK